jgi:phenylacetate-CoA ligase
MILASLRKHVFTPLYDYFKHSPRYTYWKELEKTQFLPEDHLKEIQWKRLISILTHAHRNNPFYRKTFAESGISPSQIKSPEDLAKIPILTKDMIRRAGHDMISDGFDTDRLLRSKTGGSTGISLEFFMTEACSELRNACALRHDRWTGWEIGEPFGAVWGNPVNDNSFRGFLKKRLISPNIVLDTMKVSSESVKRFSEEWKEVRPTLLFGHSHSLYLLAGYVRELNLLHIRPRSIISTSMMLMKHERDLIEKVFETRVFDRYGCEEVSLIASECDRHEGMHMNIEHLYIEFIRENGSSAAPGEEGRIIVTDLMNMAMPFIRYQVGDYGVPSVRKCSCGRGLPLMDSIVGRTADFLVKRNGTRVAGVSLIENTLTSLPGIRQMQIIQKSVDRISLKISRSSEYNFKTEKLLREYFLDIFGNSTELEFQYVEAIPQEASGKYRFSICEVNGNIGRI